VLPVEEAFDTLQHSHGVQKSCAQLVDDPQNPEALNLRETLQNHLFSEVKGLDQI
jgi:hypothetical protein